MQWSWQTLVRHCLRDASGALLLTAAATILPASRSMHWSRINWILMWWSDARSGLDSVANCALRWGVMTENPEYTYGNLHSLVIVALWRCYVAGLNFADKQHTIPPRFTEPAWTCSSGPSGASGPNRPWQDSKSSYWFNTTPVREWIATGRSTIHQLARTSDSWLCRRFAISCTRLWTMSPTAMVWGWHHTCNSVTRVRSWRAIATLRRRSELDDWEQFLGLGSAVFCALSISWWGCPVLFMPHCVRPISFSLMSFPTFFHIDMIGLGLPLAFPLRYTRLCNIVPKGPSHLSFTGFTGQSFFGFLSDHRLVYIVYPLLATTHRSTLWEYIWV